MVIYKNKLMVLYVVIIKNIEICFYIIYIIYFICWDFLIYYVSDVS